MGPRLYDEDFDDKFDNLIEIADSYVNKADDDYSYDEKYDYDDTNIWDETE